VLVRLLGNSTCSAKPREDGFLLASCTISSGISTPIIPRCGKDFAIAAMADEPTGNLDSENTRTI
jgi:hypothetical protein